MLPRTRIGVCVTNGYPNKIFATSKVFLLYQRVSHQRQNKERKIHENHLFLSVNQNEVYSDHQLLNLQ